MKVYHLGSKKVYEVAGTVLIDGVTNFVLVDREGDFVTSPTIHFRKYVKEEYCKKGYNKNINMKSNNFDF